MFNYGTEYHLVKWPWSFEVMKLVEFHTFISLCLAEQWSRCCVYFWLALFVFCTVCTGNILPASAWSVDREAISSLLLFYITPGKPNNFERFVLLKCFPQGLNLSLDPVLYLCLTSILLRCVRVSIIYN